MTVWQGQVSFLLTFSLWPVSEIFPKNVVTGEKRILYEISWSGSKSVELSISLKKKEWRSSGNIFVSPALLCRLGMNQFKSYIHTPLKSFGFFDIKGLSKTFFSVKFWVFKEFLCSFSRCLLENTETCINYGIKPNDWEDFKCFPKIPK